MRYLIDGGGKFIKEFKGGAINEGFSIIDTPLIPKIGECWVVNKWMPITNILKSEINLTELYVDATRFLRDLLTLPIYGAMEVAEVGLSAKFAAGIATDADISSLGLLRAAKAWIAASTTINLMDSAVEQVLDVCIAIPQIGLSIEDKMRILRNEAKA